jgi:hypothetical protein
MRYLLGIILMGLSVTTAMGQDPAVVSPSNYKVELENQWVRVLRLKQGPHEKTATYTIPASVIVYLTDSDQKFTGADGNSREVKHKAGDVSYTDAVEQTQENLSSKPLEEIITELKPDAPKGAGLPPVALDPVKIDAAHHTVPLENAHVRVLRTVLEPHLKGPMHEHPHYVVVYLTVLHTTMTLADGKTVDNPRKPGDVAWREPLQHITENIGDKQAVEIQIELK